jgi:hypothetical protein
MEMVKKEERSCTTKASIVRQRATQSLSRQGNQAPMLCCLGNSLCHTQIVKPVLCCNPRLCPATNHLHKMPPNAPLSKRKLMDTVSSTANPRTALEAMASTATMHDGAVRPVVARGYWPAACQSTRSMALGRTPQWQFVLVSSLFSTTGLAVHCEGEVSKNPLLNLVKTNV